jgi:hypothetical protein
VYNYFGRKKEMQEIECEAPPSQSSRVPCKIREPSVKDRARQLMIGSVTILAAVAVCMVLVGVSFKTCDVDGICMSQNQRID